MIAKHTLCSQGKRVDGVIRHFQERMPYGLFVPDVP
jgi:hypothetical protein